MEINKLILDDNLEIQKPIESKVKRILFLILFSAISFTTTSQSKDIVLADTTQGIFILINKTYSLPKNYIPADLLKMTEKYGDSTKMIKKETYIAFKQMHDDAKRDGITLWITSAYRTYNYQKWLYDRSVNRNGRVYADRTVAQPGFSEHQTGLAIDIVSARGKSLTVEFEKTKQFEWLSSHAHKYGFILRYPKDKENITGYRYEPWHYRYLGVEIATKIRKSNLTYEEYYNQFIDNK